MNNLLLSMKRFAQAVPHGSIAQQPVAQLPWGHIIRLMQIEAELANDLSPPETL